MDRQEEHHQHLLARHVEDITEAWVKRLLLHSFTASGREGSITLRRWSRHKCLSPDPLAGHSSSRVTVKVEYEVKGEATTDKLKKQTFVVKMVPTEGHMAGLLTSEGMHHVEVGQYGRFLRALGAWETEKLGAGVGVVAEIVPAHALALSTPHHFTLVLPEITNLGYQTRLLEEGLTASEVVVVAKALGRFHGTAVAFKVSNGTSLDDAFPACFHVARADSPLFTFFPKAGFERPAPNTASLRQEWSGVPERATLLRLLEPYEAHAAPLVLHHLAPREPFATAIHGDPQPTNIFFKNSTVGGCAIKLIDWAQARYSQGTYDLIYLLSIGAEPEVRRQVYLEAKEEYFRAFNVTLRHLQAGLTYPRSVFEADMVVSEQLSVVWSVASINLLYSSARLQRRLLGILTDVLSNPNIEPPKMPLPKPSSQKASDTRRRCSSSSETSFTHQTL
nr:uncharacterized protein LOC123756568 [Procambarus clarkii]